MPESVPHRPAYEVVECAAELLLECAGFVDDVASARAVARPSVETVYAVDADVVTMYLEPDKTLHYGNVLGEGVSSPTTKNLTLLLGDFLFKRTEQLVPGQQEQQGRFLLLRPHEIEVFSQIASIYERIRTDYPAPAEDGWEPLSEAFCAYEAGGPKKVLVRALRSLVPDLVELYDPYRGPQAALSRFAQLAPTTLVRFGEGIAATPSIPVLDPIHKGTDRLIAAQLVAHWESRLRKYATRPDRTRNIRADAQVLSALEYANTRMGPRRRLALITGSRYLFDAANEYHPSWSRSGQPFGRLYLRYPQGFLAHPSFFAHVDQEEALFTLMDWFNTLLPGVVIDGSDIRVDRLRRIAHGTSPEFRQMVEQVARSGRHRSLLEQWRNQVAGLAQARSADALNEDCAAERGADQLAESLRLLRESGQWSTEALRRMLQIDALQSVSHLYDTSALVGLWSGVSRRDARGIPAVRFAADRPIFIEYCKAVVESQVRSAHEGAASPETIDRLLSLNEDVAKADRSLYYAHVVHALAFGAKGQWRASLALAKTAVSIAEGLSRTQGERRRGREAAYLACIAARRSALDRQGLGKAEEYLRLAIERDDDQTRTDIRFQAEELALRERGLYIDHFVDGSEFDSGAADQLLEELRRVVRLTAKEHDQSVRAWVLRQTLTNYLTLLAVLIRPTPTTPQDQTLDAARRARALSNLLKKDEERRDYGQADDPWAYLVRDAWLSLVAGGPGEREARRVSACESLGSWREPATPYGLALLRVVRVMVGATAD